MTYGDTVITISKFIDDHVRHHFPEIKNKLVQINRGIDYKYFDLDSVSQKRKEGILNKFTIPEKCHIILLPGRITSWKGHRVAVEALNILLKKDPPPKSPFYPPKKVLRSPSFALQKIS